MDRRAIVMVMGRVARMLMGVTLLVAALGIAPVTALAHAGHAHVTQHVTQHARGQHVHMRAASVHISAQAYGQVLAHCPILHTQANGPAWESAYGNDATPVTLVSMMPGGTPDTPQHCPACCCCCMSAGCGFAWLSPSTDLAAPATGPFEPEVLSDAGSGVTPDALPEPPRTLA